VGVNGIIRIPALPAALLFPNPIPKQTPAYVQEARDSGTTDEENNHVNIL